MGQLMYGNAVTPIGVDDELLTHLRTVIVTKLRRNESFPLTVRNGDGAAETMWLHAAIPLRMVVAEEAEVNRPLMAAMMNAASLPAGLDLTRDEFAPGVAGSPSLRAMTA